MYADLNTQRCYSRGSDLPDSFTERSGESYIKYDLLIKGPSYVLPSTTDGGKIKPFMPNSDAWNVSCGTSG